MLSLLLSKDEMTGWVLAVVVGLTSPFHPPREELGGSEGSQRV